MPRSRYIKCSLHAKRLSVAEKAMFKAMGITLDGNIDVHGPCQTIFRGGRIGRSLADEEHGETMVVHGPFGDGRIGRNVVNGELGGTIVVHCKPDIENIGNNIRRLDCLRVGSKSRKSKKRKMCIIEIIERE